MVFVTYYFGPRGGVRSKHKQVTNYFGQLRKYLASGYKFFLFGYANIGQIERCINFFQSCVSYYLGRYTHSLWMGCATYAYRKCYEFFLHKICKMHPYVIFLVKML